MAMNSPSHPIEAVRNASMMASVMVAHDRDKTHSGMDERERERLTQEQMRQDQRPDERATTRRSLFQRLRDRLPFR